MARRQIYIGLRTIIFDEIRRFLRIWPQTLLSSAITIALYYIIFSNFNNLEIEKLYGITYLEYIAPGLIMMAIIINTYGNVSFSLWSHRFQHSIQEVIISPIPNYLILTGYMFGGILRGFIVGIIVTLVTICFTDLSLYSIGLTISVLFFTAALFSLAGFAIALFADKFDDIFLIPTFILTPLTYLGGVFYSIEQLSPFWNSISKINPIFYIINMYRYAMLGISESNIQFSILVVVSIVVLLFMFNLFLLNKGVGLVD